MNKISEHLSKTRNKILFSLSLYISANITQNKGKDYPINTLGTTQIIQKCTHLSLCNICSTSVFCCTFIFSDANKYEVYSASTMHFQNILHFFL